MATTDGERLNLRVVPAVKRKIIEAAMLEGRSLTDFVASAALDEAQRVIERDRVITLATNDSERFRNLIANPPEPTDALRRLLANQ